MTPSSSAPKALQRRQGRKVIVLITDGGDTASKADYQEALRAAQISEAIIYSIIMVPIEADAGRDLGGEHALIQLSLDTGGKYYYATSLAATRRRLPPDQRRAAHPVSAGLLPGEPGGRRIPPHHASRSPPRPGRAPQRELSVRHRAGYYNSKIE